MWIIIIEKIYNEMLDQFLKYSCKHIWARKGPELMFIQVP